MNKTTTLNLFIFIFLVSIGSAFGAVDVTYSASNVQNFEIFAYDCIDSSCNTDGSVSVEFPDGLTTTDGDIRIRYPDSLATPYGYGVFIVADSYVPKEVKATWHTFGQGGLATASQEFTFNQKDECSATIDDFSITNDVTANIPLVIRSQASLDATAHSPFDRNNNGIVPIPTHFLQNHYGFDVNVHLEIFDAASNTLVQSFPAQQFNAAQGNALIVGESQDVEFTWIPVVAGEYEAQMRTEVVDNQCLASLDQITSKPEFTVLPSQPADMCFVQTNGLRVDKPNPRAGELVTGWVDVTANHADGFGQLTPISSTLSLDVNGPTTSLYSDTVGLTANSGPGPQTVQFQFTAQEDGQHSVAVSGTTTDGMCSGLSVVDDSITIDLDVDEEPIFDIEFIVRNANSQAVSGATVSVTGGTLTAPVTLSSDAQGLALAQDLDAGVYTYEVSASGFATVSGSIEVSTFDRTVFIYLQEQHLGPSWAAIPDVTIPLNAQQRAVLDLDDYVIAGNVDKQFLGFNGAASGGLSAVIEPNSPHTLVLNSLGVLGSQFVTVNVVDHTGAQDTTTINVNVVNQNSPPTLEGIPDFNLPEGQQLFDAALLDLYAEDAETSDRDLVFTVKDNTNPSIPVSIDANHFIDITPGPNANGQAIVTIEVEDEDGFTDVDSFTITLGSVNTAPTLINVVDLATALGFDLVLDLTLMAVDEDNTAQELIWGATIDNAIASLNVDNTNKQLTLSPTALGTATVTLTVADPDGLSATDNFTLTVVDPNSLPQCSDFIDNDGDGLIDFPNDPGCLTPTDNTELDGAGNTPYTIDSVNVAVDNVNFGIIANGGQLGVGLNSLNTLNLGTTVSNQDPINAVQNLQVEAQLIDSNNMQVANVMSNLFNLAAASSALVNLDLQVPANATDGTYTVNVYANTATDSVLYSFTVFVGDVVVPAACSDGIDNDNDGRIDFPEDKGCANADDTSEVDGEGDFQVGASDIGLQVEEVRIPRAYDLVPGDLLVSYLKFENNGNIDLEDVKVVVMIDELGLRRSVGPEDLEKGERRSETIVIDLPYDTPAGYYPVRYSLVNGDTKRTLFREIWVN